jgi:membrane fusion protein (multidrug efflux system)
MSLDAGNRAGDQNGEQALLERGSRPLSEPENSRPSGNTALDAPRAREPASQERPSGDSRVIDSPPLHDDQLAPEKEGGKSRGFLRRHPFASVIGLVLSIAVAGGGYLYWDYSEHFQYTDDSFIAARQFSIAPEVSGYITAVPVTDNQHVNAGRSHDNTPEYLPTKGKRACLTVNRPGTPLKGGSSMEYGVP